MAKRRLNDADTDPRNGYVLCHGSRNGLCTCPGEPGQGPREGPQPSLSLLSTAVGDGRVRMMLTTLTLFAVFIAVVLVTDVAAMLMQMKREAREARVRARTTRHF